MIRNAGDRLEVSGAMTLPGATALLAAGGAALASGETVFDLKAVDAVESRFSAAVTAIVAWRIGTSKLHSRASSAGLRKRV